MIKNPFDSMSSNHVYLSAILDELILIEPWSYFVPFLLGHWADGARGSSQGLSFGNSFHLLQHGSGSFCIHGESCGSSHHSQDHEHTKGLGLWLLIRGRVVRMQVSLHDLFFCGYQSLHNSARGIDSILSSLETSIDQLRLKSLIYLDLVVLLAR